MYAMVPAVDSIKANPGEKAKLARLMKSGAVRLAHRAAQWYKEVSGGKIAKEKWRKFFDTELKRHYSENVEK